MIDLLVGENTFALDRELRRLKASFDGETELVDGSELTLKGLPDIFMGATLFANSRQIIIRSMSANKSLWNELEEWLERVGDDTHLVFVEPKPDKRTRTYKWLQKHANVTQFPLLKDHGLTQWVQTEGRELGINLESGVAAFLIRHSGEDQWQLYHELEKLALVGKPITNDVIRDVVTESGEASVFNVLDDVFSGNHRSLEAQLHSLRLHEDPYRFFGLLSSQIFVLALAAEAGDRPADQLAKDAGVHPFVVRKVATLARQLGREKVKSMVAHIARLDKDLKSLSADPWLLIESALRTMK